MRRLAALAGVLALVTMLTPERAFASASSDLAAAQRRANLAAARLSRAETALARAESEVADLQARARDAHSRLSALEAVVRAAAIRQYTNGGQPVPFVFGGDVFESLRARELARFVTLGALDDMETYRAARDDLDQAQRDLATHTKQRRLALAALVKDERSAMAEVNRLGALERRLRVAAAAEQAARRSGGRASRSVGVIVTGDWVCPVQGPHGFSDDFGQPRSGGRRHQGNDIFAPRGTPVVANVAGTVSDNESGLGGHGYFLHGDDGNTYYGAHLEAYGASGRVAAGTVIGYVGDTGDARGRATHLHFEIHPGGGGAVDPYPTLRRYC